jgi:4-alpha-glucanotransferase
LTQRVNAGAAGRVRRNSCADNADWLDDFALFMALKDVAQRRLVESSGRCRCAAASPTPLPPRNASTHAGAIHNHKLNQWLFYRQWLALKQYANDKRRAGGGRRPHLRGDGFSSDAWTNPGEFFLDDQFQPTVVAGVPPDYFSATGQLVGQPALPLGQQMKKPTATSWWLRRIRAALRLYDIVRVDHFRGFAGYWEVPASEETAVKGQLGGKGPAHGFLPGGAGRSWATRCRSSPRTWARSHPT